VAETYDQQTEQYYTHWPWHAWEFNSLWMHLGRVVAAPWVLQNN